ALSPTWLLIFLVGVTSRRYRSMALDRFNRSACARCWYMPRAISSSVRRAQSSASRLVRQVLDWVGHPVRRITAFQRPAGVLVRVATAYASALEAYLYCTFQLSQTRL